MKHLLLTALLAGCMTTAGAQTEKAPKVPAGKTPPETIPILTEDMLWPPDDAILPAFARMKGYVIGAERWMVFPAERAVYRHEMIGGSDGGVEWDGYTYVPDERIRFDSTTLLFFGNGFGFQETTGLPGSDGLRVEGYGNEMTFVRRGKTIYVLQNRGMKVCGQIDLSAMSPVGSVCYRDTSGRLGVLYYECARLWQPNPEQQIFDPATLRHVAGWVYRDDRALYLFPYVMPFVTPADDGPVVVCQEGTPQTPLRVTPDCIIYGDAVYNCPESWLEIAGWLDLDPARTVSLQYDSNGRRLLTDGNRAYFSSNGGEATELRGDYRPVGSGRFYIEPDGRTLTHCGGPDRKGDLPDFTYGALFRLPEGWLFYSNRTSMLMPAVVRIYNYRHKRYEQLDPALYRQVSGECYLYDGVLCTQEQSVDAQTQQRLDLDKLREVPCERFHTDFLTDGRWLLAARFPEHPVEADLESLRFSGPGIALDKNCIYDATGFGSELNVIPLEKLGIPIKVLTDIEK